MLTARISVKIALRGAHGADACDALTVLGEYEIELRGIEFRPVRLSGRVWVARAVRVTGLGKVGPVSLHKIGEVIVDVGNAEKLRVAFGAGNAANETGGGGNDEGVVLCGSRSALC